MKNVSIIQKISSDSVKTAGLNAELCVRTRSFGGSAAEWDCKADKFGDTMQITNKIYGG